MKTVRVRVIRERAPREAEPYRTTVDYARLFGEGAQAVVSGYETAILSEPLDGTKDGLILIMVKVPADKLDAVRTHGLALLDLWRRWGPMALGLLRSS